MPGPKNKVLLTDKFLKAMDPAPSGTLVMIWDKDARNFGVRVSDKGTRTFVVVKRNPGDKAVKWIAIGRYPDMSLKEARKKASEVRDTLVNEQKTPRDIEQERHQREEEQRRIEEQQRREQEEAEAARREGNFTSVVEQFINLHRNRGKSPGGQVCGSGALTSCGRSGMELGSVQPSRAPR